MFDNLLIPPPLQPGDTIGIIAPAGGVRDPLLVEEGSAVLERLGFTVHCPSSPWPGCGYFSDTDQHRGEEFNRLLLDPTIKALVSMRGGYGCLRMLEFIDFDAVLANPKYLVGFSDITVLQNVLLAKTGLLCLHGPVLTTLASAPDHVSNRLENCLKGNWQGTLKRTQCVEVRANRSCEGTLIGGNLSSLSSLLGTMFDFPWDNTILFLEDVHEPLYRIDRLLTQIKLAGKLRHIRGLLLGDFSPCPQLTDGSQASSAANMEVWSLVDSICNDLDIPIWGNFPTGHILDNIPLPLGAWTKMDCDNMSLHFSYGP